MPEYLIGLECYNQTGGRVEGLVHHEKQSKTDKEVKDVARMIWRDYFPRMLKSIWIKKDLKVIYRYQNYKLIKNNVRVFDNSQK